MNDVQPGSQAPTDKGTDSIGLLEALDIFWASRWLIAIFVVVGTVGAAITSLVVDQEFEAKTLLSPVSEQSGRSGLGSALGSAVSSLGGLSALAGLSLSGGGEAKVEAIATLQSEALTERYIDSHHLLPVLFSDKWDSKTQQWTTHDPSNTPTLWKGNKKFDKKIRTIEVNAKTGLVLMTITWNDPKQAAQWANDLVKLTNEYMRDRAIEESNRNISYLQEQAAKSTVVEIRNAIYQLMESEIKKQMLARGSNEYALKVIDPATVADVRVSPKRTLWTAAGSAAGLALGLGVAVALNSLRLGRARRSKSS
jgi:uncharacterized protein involved in exopolysaccharide biosynthesis